MIYDGSDFLSRWLHNFGFTSAAKGREEANAKWAQDLDMYLEFIFATTDKVLGVDFQGLVEFLELLTVQRPHIAPIIILRELQFLNRIGGEGLVSEVLRTLESKKQGRSLVGVIIESSEYTWVEATNLLRSRGSFKPYPMTYLEKETTRKELVDVLRAFTSDEFETVWAVAKGHGESIDMIFQYMRGGSSLEKAITTLRDYTYEMFVAALDKADLLKDKATNRLQCKLQLDTLRENSWLLKEEIPLANPALRFLIEKNILFVFKRTSIAPQHEMMRWAIDTYLTQFPIEQKVE